MSLPSPEAKIPAAPALNRYSLFSYVFKLFCHLQTRRPKTKKQALKNIFPTLIEKRGRLLLGLGSRQVLLLSLLIAGCTPKPPPEFVPPRPLPQPPPLSRHIPDDENILPWGQGEFWLIVVEKSCHTLNLYSHGRLVKSYPAVFGRKPGRKLYQGDKRTPTGLYAIIDKAYHNRWARFMLLDYPTEHNVYIYWQHVASGQVPQSGGRYLGVGGAIGIHGSDNEKFNRVGVNWTLGCISLSNEDVKELYEQVPTGTLVYIKE